MELATDTITFPDPNDPGRLLHARAQLANQAERIARLEAVVAAADAVIVSNLESEKCDEYDAAREALMELDGKG